MPSIADQLARMRRNEKHTPSGEGAARKRVARIERENRRDERTAADRARYLDETDQQIARLTRVPADTEGRIALVRSLRIAESGRPRSRAQIAAIMGLHKGTVDRYMAEAGLTSATPAEAERIAFGERVHRLRRAHGMSRAALAEAIGVDAATIGKWEKGQRMPSAANRAALATVLGMDQAPSKDPDTRIAYFRIASPRGVMPRTFWTREDAEAVLAKLPDPTNKTIRAYNAADKEIADG